MAPTGNNRTLTSSPPPTPATTTTTAAAEEKASSPSHSSAVLRSVEDLRGLSAALSNFTRSWDALHLFLDSISSSIDSLSNSNSAAATTLPEQGTVEKPKLAEKETEVGGNGHDKHDAIRVGKEEPITSTTTTTAAPTLPNPGGPERRNRDGKVRDWLEKDVNVAETSTLELDSICSDNAGKNLRRYINRHLLERDRLREEIPAALSRAPNPARLVLNCLGGIYLQGRGAFVDPKAVIVAHRRAAILAIEYFLLSGRVVPEGKMEDGLKKEAATVAVKWRSRLVREGGVGAAGCVDALGIVLLVACFGIPLEFGSDEMYELLHFCYMKKKANVLKHSPILLDKLPDIIQDLVKNDKHFCAAELVVAFGIEDKHPLLPLLSSLMRIHIEAAKEERREGQYSYRSLKEATEKRLAAVKSIAKFLTDHKLDPIDFASLKLDNAVAKLEKEILKFDQKLQKQNLKRKADETDHSSKIETQVKIPRQETAPAVNGSAGSLVRPVQEHYWILSDSIATTSLQPPRNSFESGCPGLLNPMTLPAADTSVSARTSGGMPSAAAESMFPVINSTASFAGSRLSVGNGVGSLTNGNTGAYRLLPGEAAPQTDNSITHSMLGDPTLAGRNYMGWPAEMVQLETAGWGFPGAEKCSAGRDDRTLSWRSYTGRPADMIQAGTAGRSFSGAEKYSPVMGDPTLAGRSYMGRPAEMVKPGTAGRSFPGTEKYSPALGDPTLAGRSYMGRSAEMVQPGTAVRSFPGAEKYSPGTGNSDLNSSLYQFADIVS